jgi:hypothetical protein
MLHTTVSDGLPIRSPAAAARRAHPPPACVFNPTCTVAVVSTIAGLRPFKLIGTSADISAGGRSTIARPLFPQREQRDSSPSSPFADSSPLGDNAAVSHALWDTPVYVATVAGESALIAVVFRARPAVFTPSTHTMAPAAAETRLPTPQKKSRRDSGKADSRNAAALVEDVDHTEDAVYHSKAAPSAAGPEHGASLSSLPMSDPHAGTDMRDYDSRGSPHATTPTELFAAEAEYRRYVYLFDATTGLCLAALHFCGSHVVALRANTAVLLVVAADLFHVVELDTLRYVRQQSMFKPPNPCAVLDLSSAMPVRTQKDSLASATATSGEGQPQKQHASASPSAQYMYTVAFPQSARGYRGDVTVLTLHTTPRPSSLPPAAHEKPTATAPVARAAAAVAAGLSSPSTAAAAPPPSSRPSMQQRTIAAHHHVITHLRLRHDGRLLVTASALGTTLKLFDCASGALLVELQRGHRPASVVSLGLQADAYRIAAISTNGTLHIFNCAAVVQSWEAGRRWPGTSALAASPAPTVKTRADCKLKVPPLYSRETLGLAADVGSTDSSSAALAEHHSGGVATASLPSDGSVQHEVGFAADGRTVWVAQVESTATQLAFAQLHRRTAVVAADQDTGAATRKEAADVTQHARIPRQERRCIGKLTCFPVLPPGRTMPTNAEVSGVSCAIEINAAL